MNISTRAKLYEAYTATPAEDFAGLLVCNEVIYIAFMIILRKHLPDRGK